MHWLLYAEVQLKSNKKCTFWCKIRCTLLCIFSCNSRCIIRCNLNWIIKRTSNAFIVFPFALSLILSIFNWPDFAFISTLKSIFKSIFKCVPYTLSFAISIISFRGAICDFVVKQIVDCTLVKYKDGTQVHKSIQLRFIDSCRFMASNLDKLASYLDNDQFKRLKEFYKEKEVFRLVRRRGYTHMSI